MRSSVFPPNAAHVIFTVGDEQSDPEPAIVHGSPFDCWQHMESILKAVIENTVWNQMWSNTSLDHDRANSTLYALNLYTLSPADAKPFRGRQLFALLFIGLFFRFLGSKAYNENDAPAGLDIMESAALKIVSTFSSEEKDNFKAFCGEYTAFHQLELARCKAAETAPMRTEVAEDQEMEVDEDTGAELADDMQEVGEPEEESSVGSGDSSHSIEASTSSSEDGGSISTLR